MTLCTTVKKLWIPVPHWKLRVSFTVNDPRSVDQKCVRNYKLSPQSHYRLLPMATTNNSIGDESLPPNVLMLDAEAINVRFPGNTTNYHKCPPHQRNLHPFVTTSRRSKRGFRHIQNLVRQASCHPVVCLWGANLGVLLRISRNSSVLCQL